MVSKWEEDSQYLIANREQDLELAAIFGKMLLDKNKELSDKIDSLEEQLIVMNHQVSEHRKRISLKNQLLKIYSQDMEDIEMKYDSLVKIKHSSDICQTSLRKKSTFLEDSNHELELETFRLANLIKDKEKNEDKVGKDFLENLAIMNDQIEILVADIAVKTRENSSQEKTIESLLSKIETLKRENVNLCSEKMNNHKTIKRMESSLQELKKEVINWKDKYDELLHFMEGIQGQFTSFQSWYKSKLPLMDNVSLASELEKFNYTENEFQYLHESIRKDQLINIFSGRAAPDGEFESEPIAELTHNVKKECPDYGDTNNWKKDQTEKLNSNRYYTLSEQWQSCKSEKLQQIDVNSYGQTNIGNCYPRVFSKLQMVKQMEGSTVLKQWQQLAVQQKGFGLSSDLYTVLENEVYNCGD